MAFNEFAPVDDNNPLPTTTSATTTDPGYSWFRRPSNLDETKREIKSSAGNIYSYTFVNPNTVPVYAKFYDALVGDVTVGTTVPVKTVAIPASDGVSPGIVSFDVNGQALKAFATGIVIAVVTGLADNSTGALTSDIHAEVAYK